MAVDSRSLPALAVAYAVGVSYAVALSVFAPAVEAIGIAAFLSERSDY